MQDQHLVQLVLERDLDRILCDGWISTAEFSARRENLRVDAARCAEIVVGAVDCSVLERVDSALRLRRSLYISSMAVREEFRGCGIARAMLAAIDAHAAGMHGVAEVYLHVEDGNTAALALYTGAGFSRPEPADAGATYLDRMMRLTVHVPHRSAMLRKILI
uniref:N-acetyltransferase domain-containing protein n=1 Tax=Cryptomonas curvata TaxID=233186 RepID=A0A7S0MQB4_9CRYP|mmetsp:Transcript_51327/g.107194  ORF Transcript_51327/g.107194 Transcript_51327/m.107194 type:complete len:162 (+) Transcript_51327:614-1099(+)